MESYLQGQRETIFGSDGHDDGSVFAIIRPDPEGFDGEAPPGRHLCAMNQQ